ncbi:hypothetical protein E4K72_11115 [Oxalobacteraceae bacterium OM1]|nr:hypothetical protein E4K72_11115 [Oxalobacteraceae bacterium OM1]
MRGSWAAAGVVLVLTGVCHAAEPTQVDVKEAKEDGTDGIRVVPKYFQPSSGNGPGSLGFSYAVRKAIATPDAQQDISPTAYRLYKLDFKADGNVAFNRDVNPADFLKTGLELNALYQHSTPVLIGAPGSGCVPTDPATAAACREEAKRSTSGDSTTLLSGLIASYETNRKFDKKNWTYGAHLTPLYRPAPDSPLNRLNPLDWPFRLLRPLFHHPLGAAASPDAFPKFRIAVERVKPKDDQDRAAILGSADDYNRGNVEVVFTTPVAFIKNQQVKFDFGWRYFREIHPDARIRAAGLDRSRYTASTLRLDSGWQLTYASGRLPLDRANEKAWELGYRIQFE